MVEIRFLRSLKEVSAVALVTMSAAIGHGADLGMVLAVARPYLLPVVAHAGQFLDWFGRRDDDDVVHRTASGMAPSSRYRYRDWS